MPGLINKPQRAHVPPHPAKLQVTGLRRTPSPLRHHFKGDDKQEAVKKAAQALPTTARTAEPSGRHPGRRPQ
jgi:hypothetical protein